MDVENVNKGMEFPRSSIFGMTLIFVILYLAFAILSDLVVAVLTVSHFTTNYSMMLANISSDLLYASRGFILIAGILFLLSLASISIRRKGLYIAGSILLIIGILPAVMDGVFNMVAPGSPTPSFLFYYFASSNVLFLLTGILGLTLVFLSFSSGSIRIGAITSLILRIIGSATALVSIYYSTIGMTVNHIGNETIRTDSAPPILGYASIVTVTLASAIFLIISVYALTKARKRTQL